MLHINHNQKSNAKWHRFSRKNYSAFCSIGRHVAIGVLSVASLTSATHGYAVMSGLAIDGNFASHFSSDEGRSTVLDELEVTGVDVSTAAGLNTRLVAVITRQQIEAAAASSPVDLLKTISGIDVRQRGAFGVQNDVNIDGSTYDQVTILLNGINISSPQVGHYSADWPVEIDNIERIEVLEGASSRLAGGGSLMGVINIVTRQDTRSNLQVASEGGSYGTVGASGRISIANNHAHNQLSGSYRRSDGGTINSGFSRGQAYFNGGIENSQLSLNWQAGFSALSHGANTFYSAAYPNQHDATTRILASLSASTKGRICVEPTAYWHRLYNHYQLIHNTSTGENFHRTDVVGARVDLSTTWSAGTTRLSGEVRNEHILSTNLGEKVVGNPTKVPGHEVYYNYSDGRTSYSVYADHRLTVGRFFYSAGFVATVNTGYDHRLRIFPGADINYRPSDSWRLFVGYDRSFRLPTFTDLYYKSVTHVGNKSLKPELVATTRLGVEYTLPWIDLKASAFYHHGTNMLDWVMYSADDVFHSTAFNLDNYGFTLSAGINLKQCLGNGQPLQNINLAYTYIDQHKHEAVEVFKSNYALEYLRHKFTASLSHTIIDNMTASWSLRVCDRLGSYIKYEGGQSTGQLQPYKPYAVLDLRIDYKIKDWLLYVNCQNLTDHRYYDFGNIPQPGLWLMAGVKLTTSL